MTLAQVLAESASRASGLVRWPISDLWALWFLTPMSALVRGFLLVVFFALTGSVSAETRQALFGFGSGEVTRLGDHFDGEFRDLLDDAGAPRARNLGTDAVRFSSQPALGGVGYVILLNANGRAEISWFYGHPRSGWRRTRRVRFQVSEDEYQSVVREVDRLVTDGIASEQQRSADTGEVIIACSDGPGYLTERVNNGHVFWLRPQCSGVNQEIGSYLTSWAFVRMGR